MVNQLTAPITRNLLWLLQVLQFPSESSKSLLPGRMWNPWDSEGQLGLVLRCYDSGRGRTPTSESASNVQRASLQKSTQIKTANIFYASGQTGLDLVGVSSVGGGTLQSRKKPQRAQTRAR